MDMMGTEWFWLQVFAFIFAYVLAVDGALGSIQDACRGYCRNLQGYFCESYTSICEPCEHCGSRDACRAVCDAWDALKTTLPSTQALLSSTPSFLPQITTPEQMNATFTDKGISLVLGDLFTAGSSPSPTEITEKLWLWLVILGALVAAMIAGYFCCQHLRKRRKQNNRERPDEEIALNDRGRLEREQADPQEERVEVEVEIQPAQHVDPLPQNPDHNEGGGSRDTIPVSVPVKKVPGQQLSSRGAVGPETLGESGYRTAEVCGTATVRDHPRLISQGSASSLSQPRSLRSTDRLTRALRTTDRVGAQHRTDRVGALRSVDQPGLEVECPLGALPFVDSEDGALLSHPVQQQDGTHVGHEYAL